MASLAANANYAAGSGTNTLTVTAAIPSLAMGPVSIAYAATSTSPTASLTFTGSVAPPGAVSLRVGSNAPVTGSCSGSSSPLICTASYPTSSLPAGSYAVTASTAADSNKLPPPEGPR